MPIDSSNLQYSPVLSSVAVDYQNAAGIAEIVIPIVPTDTKAFQYMVFAASTAFDLYNVAATEDAEVPQVFSKGALTAGLVQDYALREAVNAVLQQAAGQIGFSQLSRVTNKLLQAQSLAYEYRFATALTTDGNFLAANILTPTIKWDQPTGVPISDCLLMIDQLFVPPNGKIIAILSHAAWVAARTNPTVLEALKYTVVGGVASLESFRMLIGADEIYVSKTRIHSGAPNSSEANLSLSYLMGADVAFIVEPKGAQGSPEEAAPAWAYNFRMRVNGQLLPVYTYQQGSRGGHGSTWVQAARDEALIVVGKVYGARIKLTTTI